PWHRTARVSPPGFEPGTKGLKVPCSTVELRAHERSDTGPRRPHFLIPDRGDRFAAVEAGQAYLLPAREPPRYCGGAGVGGTFAPTSLRRATAIAAEMK